MPEDHSTPHATTTAPRGGKRAPSWPLRLPRSLRGRSLMRLRSGIGLRLALLALALGLPFIVFVAGNAARQASIEHDEAKQRTLSLAKLFAARVDDYVSDMLSALALIGHGAILDPSSAVMNDAFLQRIRADLPKSVNNVGVWTAEGRNIGALDRTSMRSDPIIANRDYFKNAVRTGKLAIEGPLVSRMNREPVVVFARPVLGSGGNVVGVVTVSTKLRELGWLLDLKGAAPHDTVVSIVNAQGVVLARSVDPDRWIGMSVPNVGRARAHIGSREGVDDTLGADNVARIAGYTQAERVPWHVFVGMPARAALSTARTNLFETVAFGSLSLLLGAVFAARLGARIAKPLRQLAYDATLLTRGNLAHRTSVGGDDETGVLANALNRLAQTVEDRTRALQEKTAALEEKAAVLAAGERFVRLIADGIPARITCIDTHDRLLFGNRRFAEYWGADPANVVGRRLDEIVSPAAHAQIKPELDRSYQGEARRYDLVVERPDGTQYYQVDHVPDVDATGTVQGVVTISQDVTALRQAKQALVASEKRMRMVADNLPALIAYLDADERYLFVNARYKQVFGLEPQEIVGRCASSVLSAESYAQSKPHLARVCRGERARFQRTVTRHGRECHELVELIPDQDAAGNVVGFYALVQDVTDVRDAQAKAEASEQLLQRITDSIPSMVGYIDCDRRYRFNSRYYETWLNRPLSEITGKPVIEVLGPQSYATLGPNLDRAFAGERVDFDIEVTGPTGARFLRGSYIPDVDASGEVIGVHTWSTDITPLKEVEHQLERLAQNDALTGLPNRHAFNEGIAAALRRSQRTDMQVALLFLDMDDFKKINDTLGHAAGDDVLREFGRRLTASVRATDLVARLAGDEFVIVLEGIHTREECRLVARKILAAMRPAFHAGDAMVNVSTSIGIALGQGNSTTAEGLLKRADSALYAAKGHGRDTYEIAI